MNKARSIYGEVDEAYPANWLSQVSVSIGASEISILDEFVMPSILTSMSKSSLSSCNFDLQT